MIDTSITVICHTVSLTVLSTVDHRFIIFLKYINSISDVMVSVLASSAVNRGFEPRSGQSKDHKIDICCVFAKYATLRKREQVKFQRYDDEVFFVLDQHAELDFYTASSLKQQSAGRHVGYPFSNEKVVLFERWPLLKWDNLVVFLYLHASAIWH
jgi:hypothetical protein